MKILWTGPRPPEGGFRADDYVKIIVDVVNTVHPGDEIGTGGCVGVDEIVMRTVLILKETIPSLTLVTFVATGAPSWEQWKAPDAIIGRSDRVENHHEGYLERDRRGVEWADYVRGLPLTPFKTYQQGVFAGRLIPVPRSGTSYTVRFAEHIGKTFVWNALRLTP